MNHLNCPLCCQQDFTSIIALREHLLYYIYRPITCPICHLSVGGIHGLTKHLELHHIDNNKVPYSEDNFNEQTDIGYRASQINMISLDSLLPFYQNSRNTDVHVTPYGLPDKGTFNNAKMNADRHIPTGLGQEISDKGDPGQEQQYNVATVDISSKYENVSQRKVEGLGCIDNCAAHLSIFSHEASRNKNTHYNSESSFSCDAVDLNSSTNDSSTLFETSPPEHVLHEEVRTMDNFKSTKFNSIKFDGFQALSEAVRAFVCITCGAKIVGKDIYFKHIQEKCSLEGNVKDSKNKSPQMRENNLCKDISTDNSMVKTSTSESLSSCHSENNLIENGSTSIEFYLNKDVEMEKPKSNNASKRLIDDENNEMRKEEIRPYIHKKFDHDQGRKIAKVPSSDVQCYIQNFQSLLVDKLNKTLESDSNKLPFMKDMEDNNFFEMEKDINFHSPSIDCDVNKPSPVASLSPQKVEAIPKDSTVNRPLANINRCKFCPKTFSKPYLLLRHQQEFHSSTTYYCKLCGNHFKSKRTLANHIGTHKEKNFHCTKCDYSCFTASGLRTHVFENHSNKRKDSYLCTLCPETFKKKYGLDRHIKRKHEINRILCQFCDKIFSCKEDLNLHMAIHLNDKSLTCNYCGKLFTSLSSLKRHKSTHNSKRESFKCNKCSKIFTRKDSLQSHIKLHE